MVYKVDWRDEKEKGRERDGVNLLGLMFAVPPRVTHPSDKLRVRLQAAHVTSSPRRVTPLRLSHRSRFAVSSSNFSLPPSSCAQRCLPLFCL